MGSYQFITLGLSIELLDRFFVMLFVEWDDLCIVYVFCGIFWYVVCFV